VVSKSAVAAASLLACACAHAASFTQTAANLVDLSLEELSNITVSTVSGRAEPLSRAPGSVYVISGEDIRRSGVTTLPEALRLAPNLHVARVDASQYAISARGFNSTTANKLQVLIDGRTVYTPLFSGTFWDAQDVLLEDVERIEVISGPGGTLWGANAVNGVINVITRRAGDTQGTLGIARAGSLERGGAVRHGGAIAGGHYRLYAKAREHDRSRFEGGAAAQDANDLAQAGFRADWGTALEGFTLQGDAYGGDLDQGRERSGYNLLGRWTRALAGGSSLRLQGYFDRTYRNYPGTFKEDLDTYDFELQHALAPAGAHRLLWGFGLRHHRDRVENSPLLAFLPANSTFNRSHVFVQDEIALRPDLDLILGLKLDRNPYTGAESLPNARLAWRLSDSQLLWAAVSRAVRAPSRIDREFFSPSTPPFTALAGGPDFRSEVARVLEIGYRVQPSARLSYSLTAYHHRYDSLRTLSPSPAGPVLANDGEGKTTGVEGWGTWRGADWWRLSAGFMRQRQSFGLRPGAVDLLSPGANGNDPRGWLKLRGSFDLGPAHELDIMLRRVGSLPAPPVPAYTAVDARLGWRIRRDTELSLVAQNLFDRRHAEWQTAAGRVDIDRALLVQLRLSL
jgi:iron complex outermembrane receptor protein